MMASPLGVSDEHSIGSSPIGRTGFASEAQVAECHTVLEEAVAANERQTIYARSLDVIAR
jgi:hypothetical protein